MRLASRMRPSDIAIVALFVGSELGALIRTPDGSRLALYEIGLVRPGQDGS